MKLRQIVAALSAAVISSLTAFAHDRVSLDGAWSFTDPDVGSAVTVTVPHSWECLKSTGALYLNVKTCSYERQVDVSAFEGQKLYLEFEGVNKTAKVYVDGTLVGTHVGGFSSFYMDITEAAAGKKSVAVKVDVTNMSFDTMPVNSDFTHWAGIYRDCYLVAVDPRLAFSNGDCGSDGIYYRTSVDLATGKATVMPQAVLNVNFAKSTKYKVKVTVSDADGNEVGVSRTVDTVKGSYTNLVVDLPAIEIPDAHLWQGTEDPYLYNVKALAFVGDDEVVDMVKDKIGLRTFEVKGNTFYLNGKEYQVRGVGMHQERDAARNATTHEERLEDVNTILEMGANAVRTAHYPHNKDVYQMFDEKGILCWNEIPFYLMMLETDLFKSNTTQCAMEMVKQGFNRCSVIAWGIENEVNTYSSYQRFYPTQGSEAQLAAFMQQLAHTVKAFDSSRLVGEAEICAALRRDQTASWTTADSGIDLVGFNFYVGWYNSVHGATDNTQSSTRVGIKTMIEEYASVFDAASGTNTTYVLTECGAGGNVEQHVELDGSFIWGGQSGDTGYLTTGSFHPEEYQSWVHEADIAALYGDSVLGISRNPRVWGVFIWSLYDFSCYRNEGGITRRNTKGLITADRQTKKDAFYLYKANWNKDDPFVHICSSRWTVRTNNTTTVKVYSNCDSVTLVKNGVSLGRMTKKQDGVFVMKNVKLDAGINDIVANGQLGDGSYSDTCAWTLKIPTNRTVVPLDGAWSFTDPDVGSAVTVTVPHSWECLKSTGYLMLNVKTCSYERKVDVSAFEGQKLYLEFEGVNKTAKVYVDGTLVGTHIGGFSSFYMDITEAAAGKKSVTVKVDVTNMSFDTMPVNSDFTHWAGIYRDCYLVAVDPRLAFSNGDCGSDGVYYRTSVDLATGKATVTPQAVLNVDFAKSTKYKVKVTVSDADGNEVGVSRTVDTVKGSYTNLVVDLPAIEIPDAHLWQGTEDPYLYTVTAKAFVGDDDVVDKVEDKIGLRAFEVKGNTFYLNGKEYRIRGVGMHQERDAARNATTHEERLEDVNTILEMGANAVRTAHYPHNKDVYQMFDEKGILCWNEIPFYLMMLETDQFKSNTTQCAMEMVKQGFNRCSVIAWGIENEVNTYASYQRFYPTQGSSKQLAAFMQQLARTVKAFDSSRLVGEAEICSEANRDQTASWTTADSGIDLVGFNFYVGWYNAVNGATDETQYSTRTGVKYLIESYSKVFDAASGTNTTYVLTEYGAGGNVNQHVELDSSFIWGGQTGSGYLTTGSFHPEEYQSWVHEADIATLYGDSVLKISRNNRVWGAFAWSLYDFSCYRNEGGITRRNTKGLITADRKTKKDAYYLYKANWNKDDPFVHICSSRWTTRTNNVTTVKVYSNCDSVTLSVNGTNLGKMTKKQDGVFVMKNVALADEEADNVVVAVGTRNGATYTETCSSWKVVKKVYTIRFNRNDGSGDTALEVVPMNVQTNLLWKDSNLQWMTPEGKLFLGWSTDAESGEVAYSNGQRFYQLATAFETVDLYAVWADAASCYTIHYNVQNCSGTQRNQFCPVSAKVGLLQIKDQLCWSAEAGKVFLGWAIKADSDTVKYQDGQVVSYAAKAGATLNLWPVWVASNRCYTVTYHRNDGSDETATQMCIVGKPTLLLWKDSQLGWGDTGTFLGWAKTAVAAKGTYGNGQSVQNLAVAGGTADLYAIWLRPSSKLTSVQAALPETIYTAMVELHDDDGAVYPAVLLRSGNLVYATVLMLDGTFEDGIGYANGSGYVIMVGDLVLE